MKIKRDKSSYTAKGNKLTFNLFISRIKFAKTTISCSSQPKFSPFRPEVAQKIIHKHLVVALMLGKI
jgi:hypothetical protein